MGSMFSTLRTDSYDSIWFWVVVTLVWLLTGQRVMGAPWDMVLRMPQCPATARDVGTLVRINVQGIRLSNVWLSALLWGAWAFGLTSVGLLGFVYGFQFAQAVVLLTAPLFGLWALRRQTARRYRHTLPEGEVLFALLRKHRLWEQIINGVGLSGLALWGGFQSVVNSTFIY